MPVLHQVLPARDERSSSWARRTAARPPQHVAFPLAERVDQALLLRRRAGETITGRQEFTDERSFQSDGHSPGIEIAVR